MPEKEKEDVNQREQFSRTEGTGAGILYRVEDVPPPHLCIAFAVQQIILCLGSTLSIPFILTKLLCADGNQEVTAQLLCISMFMCGLATLLQTTTGVRLGIVQGGSHTFIGPIAVMMALDIWKCPTTIIGKVSSRGGDIRFDMHFTNTPSNNSE